MRLSIRLVAACLFLLAVLPAEAQSFRRGYFGGNNTESGQNIVQLSGGGFLFTGYHYNMITQSNDAVLVRTTANGDTVFAKSYGAFGNDRGFVAVEGTGGYYLVGRSDDFSLPQEGLFVVKTNTSGAVIWSRTFFDPANPNLFPFAAKEVNGDLIIAGYSVFPTAGACVLKISSSGTIIAQQHFSGDIINLKAMFDSAGDVVFYGSTNMTSGSGLIFRVNSSNFTVAQASLFDGQGMGLFNIRFENMIQQSNGNFLVNGYAFYMGITRYFTTDINLFNPANSSVMVYDINGTWGNIGIYPFQRTDGQRGFVISDQMMIATNTNRIYILDGGALTVNTTYASHPSAVDMGKVKALSPVAGAGMVFFSEMVSGATRHISLTGMNSSWDDGDCRALQTVSGVSAQFSGSIQGNAFPVAVSTPGFSAGSPVMFGFNTGSVTSFIFGGVITKTNVSCNGACNGQLIFEQTGGIGNQQLIWSTGSISNPLTGLCPGTYTLLAQDAQGCVVNVSETITEPTALTLSTSGAGVFCGGDDFTLNATAGGGVPPYSYSWSNTALLSCPTCASSTQPTWGSQNYTLTVNDANGCSISSTESVITSVPETVPVCLVTVDSSSTRNIVVWEKPLSTNIESFKVYRDVIGTWYHIATIPYDSLSQFTDTTFGINPQVTSYSYSISTVDTCGNEGQKSSAHSTMHLTMNLGLGGVNNLIWDNYEGFPFIFYRIFRDDLGNGNFVVIDSVTATNTSFTDPNPPSANTGYFVEVVPPDACVSTRAVNHNSTRSNRANNAAPNAIVENAATVLRLFPNPANDRVRVEIEESGQLELISVTGELVLTRAFQSGQQVVELSGLASGVYTFRFISTKGVSTGRLVINH